ncbi:hypothetical protein ACERK3_10345 [Phycisphaerales bacterium AB-hyl4]|uniref:Uncharacterized protein n=1 Tax=Natronomicrosphaera hydrolytica TaxID=3242702 RepID=A0ABV4U530_9BACT
MNIDTFLAHYHIKENPFGAEEARHDPVFERLAETAAKHPDFPKILGRVDRPGTAVAFGEKGSGKTAMRLLIGRNVDEHNRKEPESRVLVVPYDDFNPVIDNLVRQTGRDEAEALANIRLADHQDAILSLAVTQLNDSLLGEATRDEEPVHLPNSDPRELKKFIRKLPPQTRTDWGLLSALYDEPRAGTLSGRWQKVRTKLRLGGGLPMGLPLHAAGVAAVVAVALGVWMAVEPTTPNWLPIAVGVAIAAAVLLGGYWLWRHSQSWFLARQVRQDMPSVRRTAGELRQMFADLGTGVVSRQPLPRPEGATDVRYQMTRRLLDVLGELNYVGIIVLIDRVDEPSAISGNPDRMKALIWPTFDNKFLQQERVGIKLLLPIELRHILHRETAAFFQEARLDKQNLVDRLTWSGATLYDLCSTRLRACRPDDAGPISLTDLFADDVTSEMLVDALDQMHQPRDAFKFMYSVLQEHCRTVPEDEANYEVPRLTLESVRRSQSQRVQELYRGLTPA